MSLSDLELVAQAMAPTNQAASSGQAKKQEAEARALSEKSQGQQQSGQRGDLQPRESSQGNHPDRSMTDIEQYKGIGNPAIPGLDPSLLANLSAADLAALQPLISALSLAPGDEDDADANMDDLDENDPRLQELLRQMDVAGEVADDLEGKLDRLIAALGEEEVKMEQVVEAGKQGAGQKSPVNGQEKAT